MIPRPDQQAADAYIERDQRFRGNVKSGLKTVASLGAGAAGLSSKLMPFLNQYIPADLAMKGISKLSPKVGEFLRRGQSVGLDLQQGLDFVKEKIQPALPNEDEDTEENIIKKFSPKLSGLVDKYVRAGHPIEEVEQIVRSPGNKLSREVEHMEKSLGMTFYDIIRSIYGGEKRGQQPGKQQGQPMQPMPQQPQSQPSGISGQLGQAAQPQGQGQAALMAILQKLQQARGAQ